MTLKVLFQPDSSACCSVNVLVPGLSMHGRLESGSDRCMVSSHVPRRDWEGSGCSFLLKDGFQLTACPVLPFEQCVSCAKRKANVFQSGWIRGHLLSAFLACGGSAPFRLPAESGTQGELDFTKVL